MSRAMCAPFEWQHLLSQQLKALFKLTLNLAALGALFIWPCGHLTIGIGMGKRVRGDPLPSILHRSALDILRTERGHPLKGEGTNGRESG